MMRQGTVRWFSPSRGYGFIRPDDGGEDLFVRYSAIRVAGYKTLREGQRVVFEVGPGERGPEAVTVTPR